MNDQCFMSLTTDGSSIFRPIKRFASKNKFQWRNKTKILENLQAATCPWNSEDFTYCNEKCNIGLQILIFTKNSINWIHCYLIFGGISNQTLGVGKRHITGRGSVSLVVGNNFNLKISTKLQNRRNTSITHSLFRVETHQHKNKLFPGQSQLLVLSTFLVSLNSFNQNKFRVI